MTKGQIQVAEFMRFFGQPTPDKPIQMDEETAKLRAKLILEEAFETITKGLGLRVVASATGDSFLDFDEYNLSSMEIGFVKYKEVDLIELVDGLADSGYVGDFGTAVAAGVDLEPIQDIVHFANMKKAWTADQLEDAKRLHPTAKVEDYGGGLFRLIREDGKVIKSPNFVDPKEEIAAEIERQKNCQPEAFKDIYKDCVSCPNCGHKSFSTEVSYCNECGIDSLTPPE